MNTGIATGGALAAARQLPVESGGMLLETARAAFVQVFTVLAGVSAVIMVIAAVMAALYLKDTPGNIQAAPKQEVTA